MAKVKLSTAAEKWATDRGVSRQTLDRLGVGSVMSEMPGLGKCEVIVFPYRRGGELLNWKARPLSTKRFTQKPGG